MSVTQGYAISHIHVPICHFRLLGCCAPCTWATFVANFAFDASGTTLLLDMSADNEDPRPHKWLRLAEDSTSLPSNTPPTGDLSNLTRHEEFWFDDRSIILVAQNTGFRVFRSLLAAQSTVFSDMFSSSSPHAEEMFEGCPVVHLSYSPHDVAHFLSMLFLKSQRMYVLCL